MNTTLAARSPREALIQLWVQGLPTDLAEPTDSGWRVPTPGGGATDFQVRVDPTHQDLPSAEQLATWAIDASDMLPTNRYLLAGTVDALRASLVPLLQEASPDVERPSWQTEVLREVVRGRSLVEGLRVASQTGLTAEALPALALDDGLWRVVVLQHGDERAALVVGLEGDDVRLRALLTGELADRQIAMVAAYFAGHPEVAGRALVAHQTHEIEAFLAPVLQAALVDGLDVFRPRPGDVEAVFEPAIQDAMKQYSNEVWAGKGPRLKVDPSQTEISIEAAPVGALRTGAPLTRNFPLAYRKLANALLTEGHTWVTWNHHAPGQTKGSRYDGLVWVGDHWAWFPKPWRGLKYAQRS